MFSYAVVAANTKPAKTTDRAMFLVIARILMLTTASNTQEIVAPRRCRLRHRPRPWIFSDAREFADRRVDFERSTAAIAPMTEVHGHPGLGDVALTSTEQMPQKSN